MSNGRSRGGMGVDAGVGGGVEIAGDTGHQCNVNMYMITMKGRNVCGVAVDIVVAIMGVGVWA